MTVKELSQLYWLIREIESDFLRLQELATAAEALGSRPSGGSALGSGGSGDKIGAIVAEIIALEEIIAEKRQRCVQERTRLERHISSVPDSLTRMILTLRYISGLSWAQVAASIGGGNTADGVKKRAYRYLYSTEN